MTKKILFPIISVLFILVCVYAVISTNGITENENTYIAESDAKLVSEADNDVLLGTINGEEIYGMDPQVQADRYALQGAEWTAEEMAEKMLEREALYKQAIAENCLATNEEVDEYIELQRKNMPLDPEGYQLFLELCKAYGWSEDEYWQENWDVYQKSVSIGKYKSKLANSAENELKKANLTEDEFQTAKKKIVEQKEEDIYNKYNIKVLYK